MKSAMVAAGLVIVILGAGVLYFGATNPTSSTTTTTTSTSGTLIPTVARTVDAGGLWAPGSAVLTKGEQVDLTFSASSFNTSAGSVFFYVMNTSEWISWGGCAPCASPNFANKTVSAGGTLSLTWTVPTDGSYFFVVDNAYYNQPLAANFGATFSGTTSEPITQSAPNVTLDYGGIAIIVVGALVLAFGLGARQSPKMQPVPAAAPSPIPPK